MTSSGMFCVNGVGVLYFWDLPLFVLPFLLFDRFGGVLVTTSRRDRKVCTVVSRGPRRPMGGPSPGHCRGPMPPRGARSTWICARVPKLQGTGYSLPIFLGCVLAFLGGSSRPTTALGGWTHLRPPSRPWSEVFWPGGHPPGDFHHFRLVEC